MKQFYNYIYLDPRKPGKFTYPGLYMSFLYEPFYVGKGSGNRWSAHLFSKEYSYKNNKIRKIVKEHKIEDYIIIFNKTIDEKLSYRAESYICRSIGVIIYETGPLTNQDYGGQGGPCSPRVFTEEHRKNIGIASTGRLKSQESKTKVSNTLKANYKSGKMKPRVSIGSQNPNSKTYRITNPENEVFIITGELIDFSLANNLPAEGLKYLNRVKKIGTRGLCKGWSITEVTD